MSYYGQIQQMKRFVMENLKIKKKIDEKALAGYVFLNFSAPKKQYLELLESLHNLGYIRFEDNYVVWVMDDEKSD